MSFFSFEHLPPEMQEQLRDQAAKMEMATTDFGHGIVRFMTEQDSDTLQTFKSMMYLISHSGESPLAAYWEGMSGIALQIRFGICAAHGINHDDEAAAAMGVGEKPARTYVPESRDQVTPDSFDESTRGTMKQYHVDDCYDSDTRLFVGFKCTGIEGGPPGGCGMIYQSLQDRMVHEPEHCSGCFTRTAHG